MIEEGTLLWTPPAAVVERTQMRRFMRFLAARGIALDDYAALWRWSVTETEAFWAAVWDFFAIRATSPYARVLDRPVMPGAKWFEGSRLNYAEHILRHEAQAPDAVALETFSEIRPPRRITWSELGAQVRTLATQLRALGVKPGDRVVGMMPNIPEAAVAMYASLAVGAIWSSAAPEFGTRTIVDRFTQIEPKLLFAADGYRFGDREFPRVQEVGAVIDSLPGLETVVWLPYLDPAARLETDKQVIAWDELLNRAPIARDEFTYEQVEHDHPLWIVFSSGTTGPPKAIVESHVGTLLNHCMMNVLHLDLTPASCVFFYSTTGWIMWNSLLSGLLQGARIVLYDGSPSHPGPDLLWRMAADTGATVFGASPTYLQAMRKAGLVPKEDFDLRRLRTLLTTGSPVAPEVFEWIYKNVGDHVWVASQSGGTETGCALVGSVPILPVHAGEMQGRILGMDVRAWDDDGNELIDSVGEMVVRKPWPAMPIYFWNDPDGRRYQESYFERFPGVWTHGDRIKINARGGAYIYGRSDATLNRYGVRIGSGEIYRAIERLPAIADSLIVCLDLPGGRFYMPLFVQPAEGCVLDDALKAEIAAALRRDCSPRHVPDEIIGVTGIPYTLTGKKMEVPVRKILMGADPDKAAKRETMRNPETLDWFARFAASSVAKLRDGAAAPRPS